MTAKKASLPLEQLDSLIVSVRGQKVMLDADLAALYEVETRVLNQAVQRNMERFPEDFMFQLSWEEMEKLAQSSAMNADIIDNKEISRLKSQFVTSKPDDNKNQLVTSSRSQFVTLKPGRGGVRKLPHAFTEQGVAMLSSVLRSERAVQVNIAIMRAFVSLRGMMRSQDTIKQELASLKRQYKNHDDQIKTIFLLIDDIIAPAVPKKKQKIGYI